MMSDTVKLVRSEKCQKRKEKRTQWSPKGGNFKENTKARKECKSNVEKDT